MHYLYLFLLLIVVVVVVFFFFFFLQTVVIGDLYQMSHCRHPTFFIINSRRTTISSNFR